MKFLFFGFCAAVAGFIFSPQFTRGFTDLNSVWYVLRCSLLMGGFIGLFSIVCKHDVRMWHKSKADYVVSVFVAAAVHFEGAVGRDGTIVDGNCVKAFDMCVRAVALSDT